MTDRDPGETGTPEAAIRAIAREATRVLLVGWFSFRHGEATAGDVLVWQAVRDELEGAAVGYDTAWSPVFKPGGLILDAVRPEDYSHLVFVCGPLHGPQIAQLHERFRGCRRIALGVSVLDPLDPAATRRTVPLIGVALARGRANTARPGGTSGSPRRSRPGCAARGSRSCRSRPGWTARTGPRPGEPGAGAGGGPGGGRRKISAQAVAWRWPALLPAKSADAEALADTLRWCLSPAGGERARQCASWAAGAVSRVH